MKLFAIILILSISVHQISAAVAAVVTTTTCKSSNYCMGCHATVADQCTNCYNQVTNKIGMKQLDALVPNTCATAAVLKVANSKQLLSTLTATTTNDVATSLVAELCDSVKGKYLIQNSTGEMTCESTTTYKGTALNAAAADASAVGATLMTELAATYLTNCQQLVAYGKAKAADWAGQRLLCRFCKKALVGAGHATVDTVYTPSVKGSHICEAAVAAQLKTNCEFYERVNTEVLLQTGTNCLGCKAGFAVASGNATCVAYTTDANCRVLQSTSTECHICKDSYYWDAKKCALAAKMMIAGFAVVLSLVM